MQPSEPKIEKDAVVRNQPAVAELEKPQPATPSLKETDLRKPAIQVSKTATTNRCLVVGAAVAVAARETLREMDREL